MKKIPTRFARDWDGDLWWTRREVREGKPTPAGFIPLGTDPQTGKTMGWEPAEQSPFAKLQPYEGIVWHHPDGRRAKIKRRDFPQPAVVAS